MRGVKRGDLRTVIGVPGKAAGTWPGRENKTATRRTAGA
ncbi:hypothetical protein C7S16_3674 [Burkholderia thailandensis]|uniref:Uncharacterized protein n=1 Tax=Burkholderia thailandensis TaxID=57975 RepID=A0AAW9D263_BURTH|nr:hypothetical protein [Burkholderia thailandensis]